ncbi:MAG: glutamate ABC transporter substrate-binding protein [Coriobacteriales bacterium]|nr:glutamate ABC transporter substrate-binding protein [Coriobacteriales bacterium]
MRSFNDIVLNRRQMMALGLGTTAVFGLAACGGGESGTAAEESTEEEVVLEDEQEAPEVDAEAFDAILASGPVADDDTISQSKWASKIKKNGSLRVGTTDTSTFFSLLNVQDGARRGFDAGLYQLLTRYILGDESKYDFTQVTSDTRESVLQNDTVDVVFATYSITEDRQKKIDFAGPYYTSQQSILVKKDNADIKGVDDLAGKNVAVQSGSTGPSIVEKLVPDAVLQQFTTDEEARLALEQGRVDAYVIDNTLNMGSVARNPSKYKIVGDPFGDIDPYGIGISKDADDAVDFVNAFLEVVEDKGLWAELWQVSIGDRIGSTDVPEPPAIGVLE